MIHRQNNVLLTDANNKPDFAASYTVNVLPVGAVAAANSSGTTATVDAGQGFRAGDKALIWDGTTATYVAEGLNSVTGTTLVWSSATPSITAGDLICNLGPDSGAGATPAYDGFNGKEFIFSDADGATKITDCKVTCDSSGNYDYYSNGDGKSWELIRDSGGTVASVIDGWGGVGGRLNPCDYGCVADHGSDNTNNQPRMKVCVDACVALGAVFHGPSGDFRLGDSGDNGGGGGRLLLPANFKAVNDPMFRLVRNWVSGSASFQGAMVCSEKFGLGTATTDDDDTDIWWQGGRMTVVDTTNYGGSMIGLWSKNGTVKDVVIEEWGSSAIKGFGCVVAGDYGLIDNVRAYSTVTATGGSDGINWHAGTGGKISNCHVESGDDCYTMSTWVSGPTKDIATLNGEIVNCTGISAGARVLAITTDKNAIATANVNGVMVRNLTGSSPAAEGITISHDFATTTATIKNVHIDGCHIEVGGANYCFDINNDVSSGAGSVISDIKISNSYFKATSSDMSSEQGIARVIDCNRVSITDCTFDLQSIHQSTTNALIAHSSTQTRIIGNMFIYPTTDNVAATTIRTIKLGTGTNSETDAIVSSNTIVNLPTNGYGIAIDEATGCLVSNNVIRIASGATSVIGIEDATGTAEGNNAVIGNNLSDWIAFEAADHAVPRSGPTETAIIQLNEGDTIYANNIGHDLMGKAAVTANGTPTQGATPLTARVNIVTTSIEDDCVTMPYAIAGREIIIRNESGVDLQIFPAKGDALGDNEVVDSPKFLVAGQVMYVAKDATNWICLSAINDALSDPGTTAGGPAAIIKDTSA